MLGLANHGLKKSTLNTLFEYCIKLGFVHVQSNGVDMYQGFRIHNMDRQKCHKNHYKYIGKWSHIYATSDCPD